MTATASVALAIVVIATVTAPVARRPVPAAHASARSGSHLLSGWVEAVTRFGAARRRRPTPTAEEVATWCEALARQVRSGASLRRAVETVEPASAVLRRHLDPLRRQLTRGVALLAATAGSGNTAAGSRAAGTAAGPTTVTWAGAGADLRLALDMIGVAADLGGSPAAALDRTASTLRRRATDRAERRSQAAQARISAHVLTVVPIVLLALLVLSDRSIRAAVTTPIGSACIVGGLVLNGAGWLWMRAVIGVPR